ncbi:hypothetical protein LSH36_683g03132 [Paralvinella palmiformis]|uniref:Myb/SANT-like DNA-binding domain-containing protein n=1 Tax=Paralvinella palmiformis TaxID=53620 RepID=A0AAD9MTM9_9ANNE|nr:hypothetical protein LSH36_683g03132 [Paralvinella palmiformis]
MGAELELLIQLIEKHCSAIWGKLSSRVTNRDQGEIWEIISEEMKGTGFSCRSAKELKQKNQRLCSEVRAKALLGSARICGGRQGRVEREMRKALSSLEERLLELIGVQSFEVPTAMSDDVKTVGTKVKDLRTNPVNNEAPTSKKLKLTIDEEILMISIKAQSSKKDLKSYLLSLCNKIRSSRN